MCPSFSIDILLRWSKEGPLQIKASSRQRRDISIEINIIRRCTPAECYVGECSIFGESRFLDIPYPKPIRDLVIFSENGHLLLKSGINPVGVTSL